MTMPIQPQTLNDKEQAMVGLNHALLGAFHSLYLGKKMPVPQRLSTLSGIAGFNHAGTPGLPGGFPEGRLPSNTEGIAGFAHSGTPTAPGGFPPGKFPTNTGIAGFNHSDAPGGFAGRFPTDTGGIAGFEHPQQETIPVAPGLIQRRNSPAGPFSGMQKKLPLTAIAARLMGRRG